MFIHVFLDPPGPAPGHETEPVPSRLLHTPRKNLQKYNEVGQDVEVSVNVSSREYNGKYFHNLAAWKIWAGGKKEEPKAQVEEVEDDLPFS